MAHYYDAVTASSNLLYYFTFQESDFHSYGSASVVEGVNLFSASANYAFGPPSEPDNRGPDGDPDLEMLNANGEAFYITASAAIFNDRSFTVSGWFKSSDDNAKRTILQVEGGTHSEFCINISNAGVLTAEMTDDSNNKISVTADSYDTGNAVDNDLWHHFNVSSDASDLKISLNGGPFKTVSHSVGSLVLDYQDIYIGAHTGGSDPFEGSLSHIAIYDTENASRELYLAGAETYSYEYITKTWMTRYQFSATNDTSNTHPVESLGTQATASTDGVFGVDSGTASAYIGDKGFSFNRSEVSTLNAGTDNNGIAVINQDIILFDNTNGWLYHTWFKSASVNVAAGAPALARNAGNFGAQQLIIRVNGSGPGGPGDTGKIQAYIGGKSLYSTAATYHDGDWHHVAWGAAGGTLRLWVDGAFVASTAVSSSVAFETTKPLYIGRGDHSSVSSIDERWYGWIDESHFINPPGGISATEATTSATDFYRLGAYQHNVSLPANVTTSASAWLASASMVDPTITAVFPINYSASPFLASASMVDSAVSGAAIFDSGLMTASALMAEATASAFQIVGVTASSMLATASFVNPSVEYDTVLDNIDSMTASALMGSASAGLSSIIDGPLLTASALMTTASVGVGAGVNGELLTASALFVNPTASVFANVLFKTYNQVVLEKTPFTYLTFEDVLPAEIDTPLTTIRYFRNTSGSLSYGIIDSSNISVNNTFPEVQLYTEFSPIGTVNGDYALANDGLSYVNIPESSGTTDFTISAFVNGVNTVHEWKFLEAAGFSFFTKQSAFNSERRIYVEWTGGSFVSSGSANWTGPQQFKHIGITKSGTSMSIYIDGNLNFTGTVPNNSLSGQTIYGPSQIDEFATFERVLTADEISDLANTNYREKSFNFTRTAEMIDPDVGTFISVVADPFSASAEFVLPASVITSTHVDATPMTASAIFPEPTVTAQILYIQENNYIIKLKEIGAEIGVAKTVEVDDEWIDYNSQASSSANFIFGINNINSGLGGDSAFPSAPATSASLTCNNTKWGGVFTGTEFMNFYPIYDRYAQSDVEPTQGQITGNEDWRYNEFTGPWYYTTTEDSYELVFRTTTTNQILLSGQTTYTLEDENTSNTLEDDTRVNTYIEYGLTDGKLYVTYYRDLDEDPITIVGNTNIADGNDHHIVMQRTSASGMYRSNYVLNMNIGNANQWSLQSGVDRHAVVGPQNVDDMFYSDPFTGEIFHGFEIWIDGQLDVRSASFNSTHIAPIVKSLGGRTFVYVTQNEVGQAVNNRATTSGIVGTLTTFFARFNTERINALSSYFNDVVDMPRFPQEAKILRHAALDPDTIKVLSGLALAEGKEASATLSTASASMPDPEVSTNVSKILRLYWNGPDAVGTNFGTSYDGQDFVVDTYSVTHQLSNNPSHVYNVDSAQRDGLLDPVAAAEPVIVDRWKDANGIDRLINIDTDIDLDQYSTIIFMDYPDNSDEIDAILPNNNYVYIQSQIDAFINRLKTAVINGKSLYVSSPTLAIELGLIAKETILSQEYDSNDLVSASINPFITTASVYFDTHRNNKYELVNSVEGVTDIAGFVMTDAISHVRGLYDEYHLKYENKANGLQPGDQFIIPGLPLTPSQLNRDYAGYTNNRIVNLHVIDTQDILSGDIIAKLAGTDYVTTMVIKPGDFLGSSRIQGRVFINFVEDALTLGLEDYNYGTIQTGFTSRSTDETANTVEWQYSTSRTTRKLSSSTNIVTNRGLQGQTAPTDGGGGPIVQTPTSSTFGNIRLDHDSDNESFVSSIYFDESSEKYVTNRIFVPSMTLRGINWLTSYSYENKTNVGVRAMTASANMTDATTPDTTVLTGPVTVSAPALTATALMKENDDAIWVNQNTITLTMYIPQIINLQIQKEVSS